MTVVKEYWESERFDKRALESCKASGISIPIR